MQDGEDSHFDAEQKSGDAHLEIGIGENVTGLDNVEGRRADGNGRGLPKGQEDDELDGENLQKETVLGKRLRKLNVKLNKAVHGNGDGNGIDNKNL